MAGVDLHCQPMANLTGDDVPYTNYTKWMNEKGEQCGFAGCLDYIFARNYSGDHRLTVTNRLPPADAASVTAFTALPSPLAPSDHLPVVIDVACE